MVALALCASASAADMNKTLRVAFVSAETGFDPQAISDLYSGYVTRVIFDPLYRYDYLARPFRIVPNTAAAMPGSQPMAGPGRSRSSRAFTSPTIPPSRGGSAN